MPANHSIQVTLPDGQAITCGPQTTVEELLPAHTAANGLPYLAALVNNDICSLSFPLQVNCEVQFLTLADPHGEFVYRRSLAFLLAKAVRDLYPECAFAVEHSIGSGYYCTFSGCQTAALTEDMLKRIETHLREMIRRDIPLVRKKIGYVEACQMLEKARQSDKLNLLRYRNPPRIVMFCCEDFSDVGYGVLAPATGTLNHFKLLPYAHGLVLLFPEWRDGEVKFAPFFKQPQLQKIFEEHKQWGRILGITCIADLNQAVAEQRLQSIIHLCEVMQEKKLGQIADRIATVHPRPKFVLIAGPSSSGKTTFSKRLEIHLRVNGLKAVRLEVDNYFKNRDHTPRDANGKFDFEHIEAVDLEMFNAHLLALEAGEEVAIPTFNFQQGLKEFRGNKLKLAEGHIVILEGIHCLNPRLTEHVPEEHKFKIYVSALTQLTLDDNNRISTTDLRLLRRMVRDHRTRGNSALKTLQLWRNVRSGEQQWIFPFQKEADAAFNSALDYEPAVLKGHVRPLLAEVKPSDPEYADARRLLGFLEVVNSASSEQVPPTSLIREFIGGGAFG
ncbi:MAG: Threonine--tRNA ligase 2 [Verrucomicrobiota bacterium]